jgi:hypothetical protein
MGSHSDGLDKGSGKGIGCVIGIIIATIIIILETIWTIWFIKLLI